MRLNNRRKVDLPHPEGPINATTERSSIDMLIPFKAWKSPYQKFTLFASILPIILFTVLFLLVHLYFFLEILPQSIRQKVYQKDDYD